MTKEDLQQIRNEMRRIVREELAKDRKRLIKINASLTQLSGKLFEQFPPVPNVIKVFPTLTIRK